MKMETKFVIVLLITLYTIFGVVATATTITTVNPIVIPDGVTAFNGKVTFYLSMPSSNPITGQAIIPMPISQRIVNGYFFPVGNTVSLIGNDTLSPRAYYMAKFTDTFGNWIATLPYSITGATFDLGLAQPLPITTNNVSVQDVIGLRTISGGRIAGSFVVDGSSAGYVTIQSAISAACAIGGGLVLIPNGTYTQSSQFITCSGLSIIAYGRAQGDSVPCPVTIQSTGTANDVFNFLNQTDIYIANLCIRTSVTNSGVAFRWNSTQRVTGERIWVSGPFFGDYAFEVHVGSTASTIHNNLIQAFGTGATKFGCKFDSDDQVSTKTVNGNNLLDVACQSSGANGFGLWFTRTTSSPQIMNENVIICSQCTAFGLNGESVKFDASTTADTVLVALNAEGSNTGFDKATGNTVILEGGNISAAATPIVDAQPAFTSFKNTRVQGIVQQFAISPLGGLDIQCIGLNAGCDTNPNSINGPSGWTLRVSSLIVATVNAGSLTLTQPLVNASSVFANLGTPGNGQQQYCSDCTIANPCAGGGTGAFAKRINGAWVCN